MNWPTSFFLKNPSSSPKPQAPTPDPHPVSKNHGTHRASAISVVVVAFQVVRLVEQLLKEKDLATWRCWAGGDVTHQNWWFHQPKWIHLRENLHESFCNVNLSPMSLGFPWFSCRCSPNQMPGPFGGKTRIPPPLALQTRGAKLPPVLRLQMSLEGLSRLWNSEPSRIRGRISWIYIYIMLCVFVYIYIYTLYIYMYKYV